MSENNDDIIRPPDAIRQRPAMYIGDLRHGGICFMIIDMLRTLVTPQSSGNCFITIDLAQEGTIDIVVENASDVDEIAAALQHYDKFTPGINTHFGLAVAIALSAHFRIDLYDGEVIESFCYKEGRSIAGVPMVPLETTGATIVLNFALDTSIFNLSPDFDYLNEQLATFALMHRNCKVLLRDVTSEYFQQRFYHYPGGMDALFKSVADEKQGMYFTLKIDAEIRQRTYQVCLGYANYYNDPVPELYSFANRTATDFGGSLVNGVAKGLQKACREYALVKLGKKIKFPLKPFFRGMILACNVSGGEFTYSGSNRQMLDTPGVEKTMKQHIYTLALNHMLENNKDAIELISRFDSDAWVDDILKNLGSDPDDETLPA
ncbi:MAG: hypothetical protein H7257_05765 [Taibaiella sp.]|nr:hypothetical protein [Taibaiella sp.]